MTADDAAADPLDATRAELERDLQRAIRRVQRKLRNIQADLAQASQRDRLRAHATLIVANLYRLKHQPPGSTLHVSDHSTEPATSLRFDLAPTETAQQKSESLFKQAKKLERTEKIALERLTQTQRQHAHLTQARDQIANATSVRELEQLRQRLAIAKPQPRPQQREHQRLERVPYRRFYSHELEIRVGRGAKDNDALTLHHTKPYDLWLHVRGTPGSHVVLRLKKGQAPPPEALLDAATLAVHFSNARQKHAVYKAPVEVQYTERRFVRKVRHAPPGQVLVQREKVILLEVEPTRLKRLIESER